MLCDIHCHILFGVDDGPSDIEESIEMLRQAERDGIENIILTPHFRHGMFEYDLERVEENFRALKARIQKENIKINIFLGCEYHINSLIIQDIKSGRVHTLNDSRYVLIEFSYTSPSQELLDYVYKLVSRGYIPIIAHAERYESLQKNISLCDELKDKGALIQVNAASILGEDGFKLKRTARKMINYDVVDYIASDAHDMAMRKNHLAKCYAHMVKHLEVSYVDDLFSHNFNRIINPK